MQEAPPFILPLMTLSKCKLPTESVPLQIFEPRYRLMFKLVNQSASRRFGVVLADKSSGMMESGEGARLGGLPAGRNAGSGCPAPSALNPLPNLGAAGGVTAMHGEQCAAGSNLRCSGHSACMQSGRCVS